MIHLFAPSQTVCQACQSHIAPLPLRRTVEEMALSTRYLQPGQHLRLEALGVLVNVADAGLVFSSCTCP